MGLEITNMEHWVHTPILSRQLNMKGNTGDYVTKGKGVTQCGMNLLDNSCAKGKFAVCT